MISRNIWILSFIILTACTMQPLSGKQSLEFHLPIINSTEWKSETFFDKEGKASCTIYSGYNGLVINLHKEQNNELAVAIKSDQQPIPGGSLSVNVGANHYQASEVFEGSEAAQLLNDLSNNDKAYVEFVEDKLRRKSVRWSNIIKLEGFTPELNKCKKFMAN